MRPGGTEEKKYFNPRSPHGERHVLDYLKEIRLLISIHAPRTGSDGKRLHLFYQWVISIHAPRTGSDAKLLRQNGVEIGISIHAPRTGSDVVCRKQRTGD